MCERGPKLVTSERASYMHLPMSSSRVLASSTDWCSIAHKSEQRWI